jgi:hypothetical protein
VNKRTCRASTWRTADVWYWQACVNWRDRYICGTEMEFATITVSPWGPIVHPRHSTSAYSLPSYTHLELYRVPTLKSSMKCRIFMFGLFNDTVPTVGYSVSDGKVIIDDTLRWVWMEAVMNYFKVYSQHCRSR